MVNDHVVDCFPVRGVGGAATREMSRAARSDRPLYAGGRLRPDDGLPALAPAKDSWLVRRAGKLRGKIRPAQLRRSPTGQTIPCQGSPPQSRWYCFAYSGASIQTDPIGGLLVEEPEFELSVPMKEKRRER